MKSEIGLYDILVCPVSTEKSVLQQDHGKYTFFVRSNISKCDVRAAIEKLFNKKVTSVNIVASRTKTKKQKNGRIGKKNTMKKAIVTLQKGMKLEEIFGNQ